MSSSFPRFPIGPILEHYGFDPVEPDRGWHPIPCKFHDDSDASGSVRTTDEEIFNCFSCEIKGNAVQVLMKMERIPYRDAVRRAEAITGISSDSVLKSSGRGSSLSGQAGDWGGYSAFKRTWLRGDADDS